MSSDVTGALTELARSSQRLNVLTDKATSTVHQVEEILQDLSVGVNAFSRFGHQRKLAEPAFSGGIAGRSTLAMQKIKSIASAFHNDYRSLEYRRIGKEKQFRIVVREHNNDLITWDELSRDTKIQAITALPDLIRDLVEAVQSRVLEAESAIDEVSQILDMLF